MSDFDVEAVKKEGALNALTYRITRNCEKILTVSKRPTGIAPAELDHCETLLLECLTIITELKKLQ